MGPGLDVENPAPVVEPRAGRTRGCRSRARVARASSPGSASTSIRERHALRAGVPGRTCGGTASSARSNATSRWRRRLTPPANSRTCLSSRPPAAPPMHAFAQSMRAAEVRRTQARLERAIGRSCAKDGARCARLTSCCSRSGPAPRRLQQIVSAGRATRRQPRSKRRQGAELTTITLSPDAEKRLRHRDRRRRGAEHSEDPVPRR